MSTVNHDAWKREHIRHLATEAAPSRPLWLRSRRRRIDWLAVLAGLVILVVLAACLLLLAALPWIAVR